MGKLLSILLISSICLSQEMEVDGNLKVTGTVESTTIDSLKAVIAQLQAQLAALQGGVSQRVIDLTIESGSTTNISNLFPEYNLEWAILNIVVCPTTSGGCHFEYPGWGHSVYKLSEYADHYAHEDRYSSTFWTSPEQDFIIGFGQSGTYTMKVLVTAQFPN